MKRHTISLIIIVLTILILGIVLACLVPIKSGAIAHIILLPFERIFKSKIEFVSPSIWLPGNISLGDMTLIDDTGSVYYCRAAEIKYNLLGLLKKREFTFTLEGVKFYRNIELLNSVAEMLAIEKLPDIEFDEMGGILQYHRGAMYIKNAYAFNDLIRIKGGGWIDKKGSLDCDVTFSFFEDITDKVPDVVKIALLTDEGSGWMGISFKIYGNYKKPSLHLSGNMLQLNIMKGVFIDD